MSHVMCHMAHVMCHMSRVICHVSNDRLLLYIFVFDKVVKLIGGGSYQWGLPRLVISVSKPFPAIALQRCHAQTVRDSSFYLKKFFSMLFLHNRQGTSENSNRTNLVGED